MNRTLLVLAVIAAACGDAYAYVDPAVGGALYQVLFPVFSAFLALFALVGRRFRGWLSRRQEFRKRSPL